MGRSSSSQSAQRPHRAQQISSIEDFLARKAGVAHALLVADRHQCGGSGRVISGPIFTPDRIQRYCVAHIIDGSTSADRCRFACSASGTTVAGNSHRCIGCRPACTGCDDRPWGCRWRLLSPSSCNLQWINLRKSATIALICSLVTADRLSYYPTMCCPRLEITAIANSASPPPWHHCRPRCHVAMPIHGEGGSSILEDHSIKIQFQTAQHRHH